MAKKINKFYVAAAHIAESVRQGVNDSWTHPTLKKAIDYAKTIMHDEDRDCVVIVQMTHIIRRERAPIKVEKLK